MCPVILRNVAVSGQMLEFNHEEGVRFSFLGLAEQSSLMWSWILSIPDMLISQLHSLQMTKTWACNIRPQNVTQNVHLLDTIDHGFWPHSNWKVYMSYSSSYRLSWLNSEREHALVWQTCVSCQLYNVWKGLFKVCHDQNLRVEGQSMLVWWDPKEVYTSNRLHSSCSTCLGAAVFGIKARDDSVHRYELVYPGWWNLITGE